ncbi:MAG TPA: PaaI family thioesterase [Dehalococcoidia bacterium]|nr:PaaI family thioesterase [Dehalococcoidia bacterium]
MLSWEKKLAAIDTTQELFTSCFACGRDNPVGLKLDFKKEGNEARSEFTISELYEGWYGFIHGGIICTILDEAMAYTYFPETKGVTAKAEFRFRQPAPVGVPMVVTARLVKKTRKLLTAEATLTLDDGTIIAESTSQAYIVNPK